MNTVSTQSYPLLAQEQTGNATVAHSPIVKLLVINQQPPLQQPPPSLSMNLENIQKTTNEERESITRYMIESPQQGDSQNYGSWPQNSKKNNPRQQHQQSNLLQPNLHNSSELKNLQKLSQELETIPETQEIPHDNFTFRFDSYTVLKNKKPQELNYKIVKTKPTIECNPCNLNLHNNLQNNLEIYIVLLTSTKISPNKQSNTKKKNKTYVNWLALYHKNKKLSNEITITSNAYFIFIKEYKKYKIQPNPSNYDFKLELFLLEHAKFDKFEKLFVNGEQNRDKLYEKLTEINNKNNTPMFTNTFRVTGKRSNFLKRTFKGLRNIFRKKTKTINGNQTNGNQTKQSNSINKEIKTENIKYETTSLGLKKITIPLPFQSLNSIDDITIIIKKKSLILESKSDLFNNFSIDLQEIFNTEFQTSYGTYITNFDETTKILTIVLTPIKKEK